MITTDGWTLRAEHAIVAGVMVFGAPLLHSILHASPSEDIFTMRDRTVSAWSCVPIHILSDSFSRAGVLGNKLIQQEFDRH
jgi:hypothetical protein